MDDQSNDPTANDGEGSPAQDAEGSSTTQSSQPLTDAPPSTPEQIAMESGLREALRQVVDPEINIDIVTLGLIREIHFPDGEVDVRMILTTPFCPYAGSLIQQVKDVARDFLPLQPRVTLLDEPQWSPDLMEGGDWSDWGLI